MFTRIDGPLIERTAEGAVIGAGGLGYEILLPPCIAEKVPSQPGAQVSHGNLCANMGVHPMLFGQRMKACGAINAIAVEQGHGDLVAVFRGKSHRVKGTVIDDPVVRQA